MIGRLARQLAVRFGAWALRHGVTVSQIEEATARSFSYRDAEWRTVLIEDIRQRHRARTLREINA